MNPNKHLARCDMLASSGDESSILLSRAEKRDQAAWRKPFSAGRLAYAA
jgi:hypothetical protein